MEQKGEMSQSIYFGEKDRRVRTREAGKKGKEDIKMVKKKMKLE